MVQDESMLLFLGNSNFQLPLGTIIIYKSTIRVFLCHNINICEVIKLKSTRVFSKVGPRIKPIKSLF